MPVFTTLPPVPEFLLAKPKSECKGQRGNEQVFTKEKKADYAQIRVDEVHQFDRIEIMKKRGIEIMNEE